MRSSSPASAKNAAVHYLMQLSPTARLGVIVFLLALAMIAVGLGIRSVTKNLSPVNNTRPAYVHLERA